MGGGRMSRKSGGNKRTGDHFVTRSRLELLPKTLAEYDGELKKFDRAATLAGIIHNSMVDEWPGPAYCGRSHGSLP